MKGERKEETRGWWTKKRIFEEGYRKCGKFVKWQDVRGGAWRPLDLSGFPNSALHFSSKILNLYFPASEG
jgi:hypothetical protein